MQFLTSIVLSAFVGYAAAWYFGLVEGNFALLLFMATVVTGIYWLAERFYFLPKRQQAATRLEAEAAKRREDLGKMGISQVDGDIAERTLQGQARRSGRAGGVRAQELRLSSPCETQVRSSWPVGQGACDLATQQDGPWQPLHICAT